MTEVATLLAAQVKQAVIDFGNNSVRSKQSQNHVLGVSDIGGCREYVRRMILNEPFSDQVNDYAMASFVGHAVGEYAEHAVLALPENLYAQRQLEVSIALRNGVVLMGHPDLVTEKMVVDFKTVNGLGVVRKGARQQHRWQVILYAAALIADGTLPADAWCALVYLDRSGVEVEPYVEAWPYDPDDLDEIVDWVDDSIYAVAHDEEASKDKPREWCWSCCPFVSACRGGDTDVTGLIEDEEQVMAVKAYVDAAGREKTAKRDRETAAAVLKDVNGSTGEFAVRWVSVPPQTVATFDKKGYSRLNITPIKAR